MKRAVFAMLCLGASLGLGAGAAIGQASIPNGTFVREAGGTTWLVRDGQRVRVPV